MNLMTIIIILVLIIFGYFYTRYESRQYNTRTFLGGLWVSDKFKTVINTIIDNDDYFKENKIVHINDFQDNLCSKTNPNVIIIITFYNGMFTLDWKYKQLLQEVSKQFNHDVRDFSIEKQRKFAISCCKEMSEIIRKHNFKLLEFI